MYISYSNKKACDYINWSMESSFYNENIGILCLTYYDKQEIEKNMLIKEISSKYTEYQKKKFEIDEKNYKGASLFGYGKMGKYNLAEDLRRSAFTVTVDEDIIETVSSHNITNDERIVTIIPEQYLRDKITYKSLSIAIDELGKECKKVYNNYKSIIVAKSQFYNYDLEWEAVLPIIKDKFKNIEIDIIVTEQ